MKLFFAVVAAIAVSPGEAGAPENKFQITTGDRAALGAVHDPELAWMVTVVHKGTQAEEHGVKIGDRLMKINEELTENMVLYKISEALDTRPLELTYRRLNQGTEACTEETMKTLYSHVTKGAVAELFTTLEDHKCDLNQKAAGESLTLMHKAAELGHDSQIRALSKYRAKVEEEIDGKTPMHRAIEGGHVLAYTWLVKAGANSNRPDRDGWPGPHLAVIKCQLEVLKALRIQGGDLWVAANGKTPQELANENTDCPNMPEAFQRWVAMKKLEEEREWEAKQAKFESNLKSEL